MCSSYKLAGPETPSRLTLHAGILKFDFDIMTETEYKELSMKN